MTRTTNLLRVNYRLSLLCSCATYISYYLLDNFCAYNRTDEKKPAEQTISLQR